MAISRDASIIRAAIIKLMGGRCVDCPATSGLEFSHERPTTLSGEGRGATKRIIDVCRNIDAYKLRCKSCHTIYDGKQVRARLTCRYHQMPFNQCGCPEIAQ